MWGNLFHNIHKKTDDMSFNYHISYTYHYTITPNSHIASSCLRSVWLLDLFLHGFVLRCIQNHEPQI